MVQIKSNIQGMMLFVTGNSIDVDTEMRNISGLMKDLWKVTNLRIGR